MSPKVKRRLKRSRVEQEEADDLRGLCRIGKITNDGLAELLTKLRHNPDLASVTRITGMTMLIR